jgi:hypothetical protein
LAGIVKVVSKMAEGCLTLTIVGLLKLVNLNFTGLFPACPV